MPKSSKHRTKVKTVAMTKFIVHINKKGKMIAFFYLQDGFFLKKINLIKNRFIVTKEKPKSFIKPNGNDNGFQRFIIKKLKESETKTYQISVSHNYQIHIDTPQYSFNSNSLEIWHTTMEDRRKPSPRGAG